MFLCCSLHDIVYVSIYATPIMQVTMHKHLGLTLDCRLSWALHTSAVIFTASQKIGLLCRLHHHLPPLVIQSMSVTCIRPAIELASVAWSGVSTTDAEQLERAQRSAARLIAGAKVAGRLPRELLLARAGLDSLQQRHQSDCCAFGF